MKLVALVIIIILTALALDGVRSKGKVRALWLEIQHLEVQRIRYLNDAAERENEATNRIARLLVQIRDLEKENERLKEDFKAITEVLSGPKDNILKWEDSPYIPQFQFSTPGSNIRVAPYKLPPDTHGLESIMDRRK
jgi:hypothetical protein